LNVQSTATSSDPDLASVSIFVYPEGENAAFVTTFDVNGGNDDSSIVNAGPGQFYLSVISGNAEYTITVDDCRGDSGGTSTPQGDQSTPAPKATPVPKATPKQKEKVMRETVPKRPLPPTGGTPSSYAVYGFVLGGASVLALGLVRRGR
jgi:hypothetical protein